MGSCSSDTKQKHQQQGQKQQDKPVQPAADAAKSAGADALDAAKLAALAKEYKPASVDDAWKNHFDAFGAQDPLKIMLDYDEDSVLRLYTQETNELKTFKGTQAIFDVFVGLFADIKDPKKVGLPAGDPVVETVNEAPEIAPFGHVFLLWTCAEYGFDHVTDTFIFDHKTHKILRQNVVVHSLKAPAKPHAEEPELKCDGKVQAAWDNHFAAFGGQDDVKIMADYKSKGIGSAVRVFNHMDQKPVAAFKGDGIQLMFRKLFHNLADKSDVSAPVIHCEKINDSLGQVFLIWRSPKNGYAHATDTFVIGTESGKILRQNVVTFRSTPDKP